MRHPALDAVGHHVDVFITFVDHDERSLEGDVAHAVDAVEDDEGILLVFGQQLRPVFDVRVDGPGEVALLIDLVRVAVKEIHPLLPAPEHRRSGRKRGLFSWGSLRWMDGGRADGDETRASASGARPES